jgi:hypothetical protein
MQSFLVSKGKSWLLSLTAAAIVVMTVSCQPDNQILDEDITAQGARITNDYEVREGTLHFRDGDAFLKAHQALSKMKQVERIKFAETAGFKSLLASQSEFTKAREAAEAANNEEAYRDALTQYADIISWEKDQTLVFNVRSPLLASYLDRTGVLYIGKALYKFSDLDEVIVLDGDRAKLNNPESDVVKRIAHTTSKAGARTTTCQYIDNKIVAGTSCNDRRSRLSVITQSNVYLAGNGKYVTILTPYALAYPYKKNFWGSWVHYTTDNRMYSHWTYTAYCTEPGNVVQNTYANYVDSNNWDSIEYWGDVITFSNVTNPGTVFSFFEFPTDNGWHDMICVNNAMSCY